MRAEGKRERKVRESEEERRDKRRFQVGGRGLGEGVGRVVVGAVGSSKWPLTQIMVTVSLR